MKQHALYKKCKDNSAVISPIFSKSNLPFTIVMVLGVLLVEPLIMYKYRRTVPFSFDYYIQQIEFALLVIVPLLIILFWLNSRESEKQNKGYRWVGKFEVLAKQSSFLFCYLQVAGEENRIKVDRPLFEKTKVGDTIMIHRDSLGNIEKIEKVNNLAGRVARLQVNNRSRLYATQ